MQILPAVFLFDIVIFLIDGNGFKTSTMRLGADVIVFSRCSGKDGKRLVDLSMLVCQGTAHYKIRGINGWVVSFGFIGLGQLGFASFTIHMKTELNKDSTQ